MAVITAMAMTMAIIIVMVMVMEGSKLTPATSRNASDLDKLRVRKISTSKRLLVKIVQVSQTCNKCWWLSGQRQRRQNIQHLFL